VKSNSNIVISQQQTKGDIVITEATKIGDKVTTYYGETWTVIGETPAGKWWVVLGTSGRESYARKITADTVIITGQEG